MTLTWVVGAVFLITYAIIASEKIHRTLAALLGGVAMILLGSLTQGQAFHAVDWNVIFLLVGMMAMANVMRDTGLFQWIAVKAVRLGRGRPYRILVILSLVTAVSSAFLNNVTIVVLVVPVTLFVASRLRISPVPFLLSEIIATNIGGTATLIGDPPNVLIASAANIDFLRFAANMVPISVLALAVYLGLAWFLFKKELQCQDDCEIDLDALDATGLITDRLLLTKTAIVGALVLAAFLLEAVLRLEPATIALCGATILLLWGGSDVERVLRDIEWTTLFFFIGLFIVVEAVVQVGIIDALANELIQLTRGNLPVTTMLILWGSALASGVVDNIPYTATMIPVVINLGNSMHVGPLWWALALGADFGGNATLIGASSNIIVASLAARAGHPISFRRFLVYGLITTFMTLLLSTIYIWLLYLL